MANLEVLALDTAVPQIRAPGAGDGYSVPRDMTMASGTTLTAPTVNATTVDATNVEVTNVKAKDGTAALTIADSTGVVTAAANPILNAGTANGVLYLNASKVATSGSAITFDGTNFATTGTASATKLVPTGNVTAGNGMYLPAANTLAFSTNGSERVRVDSSGNVGIGTTSPSAGGTGGTSKVLQVDGGTGYGILNLSTTATADQSACGLLQFCSELGSDDRVAMIIGRKTSASTTVPTGILEFYTANAGTVAERARITAAGFFKASNTGTYANSTNDRHEFNSDKNDINLLVNGTNTGANVINVYSVLPAGGNAGAFHFAGVISGSGLQFQVDADGDVKNTNNSYGSISDVKVKQDIVDAASQWDDIKNLRVRKYRLKNKTDEALHIGLVAQEAETVSPGLVDEYPDYEDVEVTDEEGNVKTERQPTGTTTKSVKYSILYMKAIKALQEAMTRIEQLEAKVAALESK